MVTEQIIEQILIPIITNSHHYTHPPINNNNNNNNNNNSPSVILSHEDFYFEMVPDFYSETIG